MGGPIGGARIVEVEETHVLARITAGSIQVAMRGVEVYCGDATLHVLGTWTATTGAVVSKPDELRREGSAAWSLTGEFQIVERVYKSASEQEGPYVTAAAEGRIDQIAKDFVPIRSSGVVEVTIAISAALALLVLLLKILVSSGLPGFSRIERPALLDHPTRRALTDLVAGAGARTEPQCVEALGQARGAIRKHLGRLVAGGILARTPTAGGVLYHLVGQGKPDFQRPADEAAIGVLESEKPVPLRLADAVRAVSQRTGYSRMGAWKAVRRVVAQRGFELRREGREVWVVRRAPG
ncbi:MAG: helix-turn-helix transcriptional regulator [Euryarchaeota archaeon]|nr:helix-turn-helix transcriptional regulator [Euryarchaeota archaeon]